MFEIISLRFQVKNGDPKMEVLKKLANIKDNKPYRGFSKLPLGNHLILNFRTVKNKFCKKGDPAKTILVELQNEVVFLPNHFMQKISEPELKLLNELIEEGQNVYLFFGGKTEGG